VLQKVVRMLDLPRRQVFIEAMIFEVSLTKNREFGAALHGGAPAGENGLVFGVSSNDLSSLSLNVLPTLTLGAFAGQPIQIGGLTLPPVGILMNLAAQDSEANILSNPTLLATDNEEAEITVGQNIPVPSGGNAGSLAGLAGGAAGGLAGLAGLQALVPQISRQDIGVTLSVTPQINEGDFVTLKMEQSITAIQSVDASGPTLSNRRATTTVTLKDQQTVAIGGLMEDRITTTVKKVPILGDIPLLGYLFRSQKKLTTKTNLIIVLTPYIIKDPSDFARILEQKLEERRRFIEQFTSGNDGKLSVDLDYRRKKGPLDQVRTAMEKAEKDETEKAALKKDIIIGPPDDEPTEQPNNVPANPPAPENKLEPLPNNGGANNSSGVTNDTIPLDEGTAN
jgi:general secretion pathway protein D